MPLTALIFLGLTGLAGASLFFDSDINIQSEHIVAKNYQKLMQHSLLHQNASQCIAQRFVGTLAQCCHHAKLIFSHRQ